MGICKLLVLSRVFVSNWLVISSVGLPLLGVPQVEFSRLQIGYDLVTKHLLAASHLGVHRLQNVCAFATNHIWPSPKYKSVWRPQANGFGHEPYCGWTKSCTSFRRDSKWCRISSILSMRPLGSVYVIPSFPEHQSSDNDCGIAPTLTQGGARWHRPKSGPQTISHHFANQCV